MIPKAFQLLGVGLGLAVLAVVGFVTWFTIMGLVHRAERSGKDTYAGLVRATCGKPAKWGILFAVFTNCLGMCTVGAITRRARGYHMLEACGVGGGQCYVSIATNCLFSASLMHYQDASAI